MTSQNQLVDEVIQHLRAAERSLRNFASPRKVDKYLKMCMGRIDKFPLECMILETREAIESMWAKCLKSEEDLQMLKESWSHDYSEAALQEHKAELDRLRTYYTNNKEIIDMIKKYDTLWECLSNLDKQTNDPERLFKNRGAQLLKEEHDRKLSSKLPHYEKSIMLLLEKRKKQGYEEFLIRGEQFSDMTKRRWEEHKRNASKKRSREQLPKPQSVGPDAKKRHIQEANIPRPRSAGKDFKIRGQHEMQENQRPIGAKNNLEFGAVRSLKLN